MRLAKLSLDWSASPQHFVQSWSSLYSYPQEYLYSENIGKSRYTASNLERLFVWKNGTTLSAAKATSLKRITDKIQLINQLHSDFNRKTFDNEFKFVSAIWKIFLLHVINPQSFPIFDQHVFRSYYFLEFHTLKEIPDKDAEKEAYYDRAYVSFLNGLVQASNMPGKKVDEALLMFGKFLKSDWFQIQRGR